MALQHMGKNITETVQIVQMPPVPQLPPDTCDRCPAARSMTHVRTFIQRAAHDAEQLEYLAEFRCSRCGHLRQTPFDPAALG